MINGYEWGTPILGNPMKPPYMDFTSANGVSRTEVVTKNRDFARWVSSQTSTSMSISYIPIWGFPKIGVPIIRMLFLKPIETHGDLGYPPS